MNSSNNKMNHQEISIMNHRNTSHRKSLDQCSLEEQLASLQKEVNHTRHVRSMYRSRACRLKEINDDLVRELQNEAIWHNEHRHAERDLGRSERANAVMSLRIDQMRHQIKTLEQDAKALKESCPLENVSLFDKMNRRMSDSLVTARSNIERHLENECA
jgi:hypothetical protein